MKLGLGSMFVVSMVAASALAGVGAAQAATGTYYVSATGNDSNSGLSPSSAWKTIGKVNSFTFPQGSLIYFEGGQTFTGCLVFDSGNVPVSAASTPFRVYSSGSGQATIKSNCAGTYSAAVTVDAVNGFQLNNVTLVNGGTTAAGVLLENQKSATPTQTLTVSNSSISGFTSPSGSSSAFGGEIQVLGYAVNGNNGPMNDVRIVGNKLHGTAATSPDRGIGGWGYGENITNVKVQGNTLYNLGMRPSETSAAITANGWNGAVVEHNKIYDIGANVTSCGGTSGIEAYTSNNVTVRHNEVFRVQPYPAFTKGCDWDAIDLDGGTTNSLAEYNYTHDNAGSGFLAYTSTAAGKVWGPNTYRYNVSVNDDRMKVQGGLFDVVPSAPKNALSIYGNTFFDNTAQTTKDTSSACLVFGYAAGTWGSGSQVTDNICYLADKDKYGRTGEFFEDPYGQTGMKLSHNLYYSPGKTAGWHWGGTLYPDFAAWQAANRETSPLWADPLFAAAGTDVTCSWTPTTGSGPQPCPDAYRLRTGSPAIGKGVAVTGNGGLDYYQSAIANPPNVGADAG